MARLTLGRLINSLRLYNEQGKLRSERVRTANRGWSIVLSRIHISAASLHRRELSMKLRAAYRPSGVSLIVRLTLRRCHLIPC